MRLNQSSSNLSHFSYSDSVTLRKISSEVSEFTTYDFFHRYDVSTHHIDKWATLTQQITFISWKKYIGITNNMWSFTDTVATSRCKLSQLSVAHTALVKYYSVKTWNGTVNSQYIQTSVRTSQTTHFASTKESNRWILYTEMLTLCANLRES